MLTVSRVILVLTVLMLLPCAVSAGTSEGRLAYRKGDYVSALREFSNGVQDGPVNAFFLALMYLHGEGVPRDEARALVLLRNSADGGYSAAQYLLGQRYFYGRGLSRDIVLAKSYLLAASEDDYRAVVLLKIIEKGSRGEKKDRESIVATVKRKAQSNVPAAQYILGFMYLVGDGVAKNAVEEVRWYRAAAVKSPRAAFMLSLMYHDGEGVPRSPVEAFRLMRNAADRGDDRARYYLGTFYYQGVGTPVDRPRAAECFRLSAKNGYAEAQLAYGMILLSGDGVPADKSQAIEWLSKAANQDNARAREVVRELLTYRGQPVSSPLADATNVLQNTESRQNENQLRLEGKGVILDQGTFGLKFSLPTLYDAYAPQRQNAVHPLWDRLQGGILDIIIRAPQL